MRHFRVAKTLITLPIGIAILLSAGLGHALGTNQSSFHTSNVSDSKNHCHASCILAGKERQKKLVFQDDDIDPEPFQYVGFNLPYIATIYAVTIGSLALLLLRRRPPDLLAQYSYWLK